jgi:hypothetical protein
LLNLRDANLYREGGAVLAPVTGLEGNRFACDYALLQALDGDTVETDVEIASMPADQLFPAVAQTNAGLAVDIEDGRLMIKQKESVSRVVHEGAERRLACVRLGHSEVR